MHDTTIILIAAHDYTPRGTHDPVDLVDPKTADVVIARRRCPLR